MTVVFHVNSNFDSLINEAAVKPFTSHIKGEGKWKAMRTGRKLSSCVGFTCAFEKKTKIQEEE